MNELTTNQAKDVQGGWGFSLAFVFSGPAAWVALGAVAVGVAVGKATN